jgi:hypothetical protein
MAILKPLDENQGPKDSTPKKIKNIAKLEAHIVNYNDGEGRDQTRIVFRVPGAKNTFVLQERINGVHVATATHDWFANAVIDATDKPVKKAVKSV